MEGMHENQMWPRLFQSDLYNVALIDPFLEGSDTLLAISGYATPAMASWHFTELTKQRRGPVNIHLIIGMTAEDGLSVDSHAGFQSLVASVTSTPGIGRFTCSYVYGPTSVHAKTYVWLKGNRPTASFMGSANYTQRGFGVFSENNREELLQDADPGSILDYYQHIEHMSVSCTANNVDQMIMLHRNFHHERDLYVPEDLPNFYIVGDNSGVLEECRLTLLDSHTGQTGTRSGLNHGQRPGRDANQAYIPVPVRVQARGFFPPAGGQFTVTTDDGRTMLMACGGTGGKNLMTPQRNSLLGEYFRERLGLASGEYVSAETLRHYRSTADVTFHKIDDETYLMDFSPN